MREIKLEKVSQFPLALQCKIFLNILRKISTKKREVIGYEITKNSPKMALVYT
jgi:hypothetical protein